MANRVEILSNIAKLITELLLAIKEVEKGLQMALFFYVGSILCSTCFLIYACYMNYMLINDLLFILSAVICFLIITICFAKIYINNENKRKFTEEKLNSIAALRDWGETRDDELYRIYDEINLHISSCYEIFFKSIQQRRIMVIIYILSIIEICCGLFVWVLKMNQPVSL